MTKTVFTLFYAGKGDFTGVEKYVILASDGRMWEVIKDTKLKKLRILRGRNITLHLNVCKNMGSYFSFTSCIGKVLENEGG